MIYAYIDGDDIGLKIEMSFLNSDEESLRYINGCVKKSISLIEEYLLKCGAEIIFSGADGVICKSERLNLKDVFFFLRNVSSDINFSIGGGNTLKDSYIALRFAKSNGKNIAVFYDTSFVIVS